MVTDAQVTLYLKNTGGRKGGARGAGAPPSFYCHSIGM